MLLFFRYSLLFFVLISFISCSESQNYIPVNQADFQITHNDKAVDLYTLKNQQGMTVKITNYGGKIVSILVPDRDGQLGDVSLGYESASEYIDGIASLGATMGRYANRIAGAQFTLDDSTYQLDKNNGEHSIHGGNEGFRFQVWDARQISEQALVLSYLSEDGEGGYPGNLKVEVTFTVTDENELKLDYAASSDKKTVINLTNHAFFNLAGEGSGDISDHVLYVNAAQYTPVDSTAIPTGELREVAGTPFDFTTATRVGERIDQDNRQLTFVGGYDHNFVLEDSSGGLTLVARLSEPTSGRVMEVHTTEPGLQVYTANSLSGSKGKGGHTYGSRSAICLETQHFPDSPHHPNFPSTILGAGEEYESTTVYKFSAIE
jgi:aldose 1-epimerase